MSDCFSDHSIIFCVWKIKLVKLPPKSIKIRQYKKLNSDLFINDLININWDRYQLIPNVQDAWDFLYDEFTDVVDRHAPWRTVKVKGKHLPWINSDLISLFRERDKAWATYRRTRDNADWEVYRQLRNMSKTKTRNAKSNYYKESLSSNFKNPKQFWNQIKTIINTSDKHSINKIRADDTIIHDSLTIAQTFNQHFSTVCSSLLPESNIISPSSHISACPSSSSFSFRKISPLEVQNAINDLKMNSSPGLDGLENRYIKLASHVLIYPLADLFNLSLSTCEIPAVWKCARITPLHKGGDVLDTNNYRPISIICSIAKVFEKLIYNQLSHYLTINNILTPFQSGFRSNYSTTTALLKFTNDVFSAAENGELTGAIFIDLSKAFDFVDRYLLLDKLYNIGLSLNAVQWFSSYLHNRKQCVVLNGYQSDFLTQQCGVPQGSTLGPLLFSIYVNNLPTSLTKCRAQLYADDTVIYTSQSDITQIQSSLQSDFISVQEWLSCNKLLLNKSKSYIMIFGTRQKLKSIPGSCVINCNDGSPLHKVDTFKYLGVWLDSELTFKSHINHLLRKVNFGISMLFRSRTCFSFNVRKKLATQLILPIIDYCDVIYQSAHKSDLALLNIAYNRLCRFVLGCPFLTHHCTMYTRLNWPTLNMRRHMHWLQLIYKCIYFNYPSYLQQYLIPYTTSYHIRHSSQPFFSVPNVIKSFGRRAFMFKAPADWNNLPANIRSSSSLGIFKHALSSHLMVTCSCFH